MAVSSLHHNQILQYHHFIIMLSFTFISPQEVFLQQTHCIMDSGSSLPEFMAPFCRQTHPAIKRQLQEIDSRIGHKENANKVGNETNDASAATQNGNCANANTKKSI